MSSMPGFVGLLGCLTSGSCRAHLVSWLKRYGMVAALLGCLIILTVMYVELLLSIGPVPRPQSDDQYECPPLSMEVLEPTEPPPIPPPELPKVIQRPAPDVIKNYARDRLNSMP